MRVSDSLKRLRVHLTPLSRFCEVDNLAITPDYVNYHGRLEMSLQTEKKVEWGPCCFCGTDIWTTEIDPCRLTVETRSQKWQVWFCHSACFKRMLADPPELKGMFTPAHF